MAAPVVRGVGAVAANAASVSPGLPTGTAVGDLLLMFVETAAQGLNPSGWTGLQNSSATGTMVMVWYRVATGSDATATGDSGDHQLARIIGIEAGTWDTTDPFGADTEGTQTSGTSKSIGGSTTDVDDALVFAAIAGDLPDANGTANWSNWANADLTSVTERIDDSTNAGNGGSLGVATGIKATAGAFGATTVTAASNRVTAHLAFSVNPVAAPTAVGRSLQGIWNVRSALAKTLQAVWNVQQLTSIGRAIALAWHLSGRATRDLDARWTTLSRVARTAETVWHLRTKAARELQLDFGVRASIASNIESLWNLRATANREIEVSWDALERAHRDLEALWDTRETTTRSADLRWDVLSSVARDIELVWDDLNTAATTLGLSWNTREASGAGLDLRWDVFSEELVTAIGRALGLEWDTLNASGKSLEARWDLSEAVRRDIEVLWNTTALLTVGLALELAWNVRNLTAAQLNARWHVLTQIAGALEVAIGNAQLAWATGPPINETTTGAGPQSWQTERPSTGWDVGRPTT